MIAQQEKSQIIIIDIYENATIKLDNALTISLKINKNISNITHKIKQNWIRLLEVSDDVIIESKVVNFLIILIIFHVDINY